MNGVFSIDGYDIFDTWGIFVPQGKGFYQSLLKGPSREWLHAKSWENENGTRRIFTGLKYPERDFDLPFVIQGANTDALVEKYNAFRKYLREHVIITLAAIPIDRQFKLKYLAMPEYKNLTPFYDDEQVLCEFKLTFKEQTPAVFLDASGDEITLSFPPDIPDEPINFDDYDFNIVGTDLIMSGPDVSGEGMKFNGNPISDYGLSPREGCMAELQKGATRKSEIDGVFHTRDLELPFIMEADDVEDFLTKYYALMGYLLDTRYLTIDAFLVKQRYRVVYNAMSSLNEKGLVSLGDKIVFEIILSCYDDNPAQDNSISLFDGQFNINSQGELIYSQSDEFDERIGFKIVDGELIKVTEP